jgi:methionyl-tRNA formyltransferase
VKILFAGTPLIAVPSFEVLAGIHAEGGFCEIAGVLTNPDKFQGRRKQLTPSDVGAAAVRLISGGVPAFPILKTEIPDENCFQFVISAGIELLVTFAYGAIFTPEFLGLFPMGGINVHPSLLPKYRGAAPIPAAILSRDSATGISIQRMAADVDSGNIVKQEVIPLSGMETCESLSAVVAQKSAALLVDTLRSISNGQTADTPQNHQAATYCGKLKREDGRIDWRRTALDIDASMRAFTPWPLSYTKHGGMELYILKAAPHGGDFNGGSQDTPPGTVLGIDKKAGIIIQTGDGLLAVSRLQYGTRKALDWQSFLSGARNFIGSRLE